jgi:hypothetical protein
MDFKKIIKNPITKFGIGLAGATLGYLAFKKIKKAIDFSNIDLSGPLTDDRLSYLAYKEELLKKFSK